MISKEELQNRENKIFLILSGIFLGTLGMINILGVTRFIDLSFSLWGFSVPMIIAVGVLPYPITFLCTDLISEIYGKDKATDLVWTGLIVNLWIIFILWIGGLLPGFENIDPISKDIVLDEANRLPIFYELQQIALGSTVASMLAYLTAQFCDVHLFHFWKNLTKGKHLWLRNNASTMVSQLIDTTAVILITHFYANALPLKEDQSLMPQLLTFIVSGYVFKLLMALIDTIPLYLLVKYIRQYLCQNTNETTK